MTIIEPFGGAGDLAELGAAYDFTEVWLANRRFSPHTKDAYRRDIHQWLTWCAEHDLDPLQVRFLEVNAWARAMESPAEDEHGRARKPLAPKSIARKMSAVSSWYTFITKLGKLPANPVAIADRPSVDRDHSTTASFTREDAGRMLEVSARGDEYLGACAPLLAAWLVDMGTRATETIRIMLDDLDYHEGFRVVWLTLKGGRRIRRPLPAPLVVLLDEYLLVRGDDPGTLFLDRYGAPLHRFEVARFVKRLAKKAQLRNAEKITPHSFRHAWNSMAREAGATLEDRQDAMGHKDPRTTRSYDRAGRSLVHDPAMLVAAAVARRPESPEEAAE